MAVTVAGAASAVALVAVPAPAQAEPQRAQLTYDCMVAPRGLEAQAQPYPFVVALELDTPATVAPGDTVPLNGTMSVQIPESIRTLAAQYFTDMQVVSDSITIPVTIGGETTNVTASRFDSGRVAASGRPLVVSSVLGAGPVTVPDDATGEVRIGMPRNGAVPGNISGGMVAFSAQALLSGGLVSTFVDEFTYRVACTAPGGAYTAVAAIPVSGPGDASRPQARAAGAAPAGRISTGQGAGGQGAEEPAATGRQPAATPPARTAEAAPAAPESAPDATSAGTPASGTAAQTAPAAQPDEAGRLQAVLSGGAAQDAAESTASPAEDGTVQVPGWLVLVGAVAIAGGAIALAVRSHRRVVMLQRELEDEGL
ncbi:hypothetical protein [Tomitella gaofuii]|uniref:hypothetical protein n=1 Tax=Tomitella gaofuii TaxID=2760083 RepID=UPI0015FA03D2|nr:hypothetical protein [Tomitella gaofuii]